MTRTYIESELKTAQMTPALMAAAMTTPNQDIIDLQKQLQSLISKVQSKQHSLSKMYRSRPRPSSPRQRALQDQVEQESPAGYDSQSYDTSALTDQIRQIKILIPWIKANQDHYNSVFFLLKNYVLRYKVGFVPTIKKMHLGDTCNQIAQKVWSNLDSGTLSQMSTWNAFHRGWFIMSKMAVLMPQIDFLVSKIKSIKPSNSTNSEYKPLIGLYNQIKKEGGHFLNNPSFNAAISALDFKWGSEIQKVYNKSRNVSEFILNVKREVGFKLLPVTIYQSVDKLLKLNIKLMSKAAPALKSPQIQEMLGVIKGLWSPDRAGVEDAIKKISTWSKLAKGLANAGMIGVGIIVCVQSAIEISEKIRSGAYEADIGDRFELDVAELVGSFLTIPQIGAQLGGIPFVVGSILWAGVSAMKASIANDVTPDQKQVAIYEYFKDKMHDSTGINTISSGSSQYSAQVHQAFLEVLGLILDNDKQWPRDFNFSNTNQSWLESWQKEFLAKYPWFSDSESALTIKLKDVMNNYYKYFYQFGNFSGYNQLLELASTPRWEYLLAQEKIDYYKTSHNPLDKKTYSYIVHMAGSESFAAAYLYGLVLLVQCGKNFTSYQKKQACINNVINQVAKINRQVASRLNGIGNKVTDISAYILHEAKRTK